jgi:tRNA nucleotidyltransferase (CCA-adding enzyme)
MVPTVLDRLTGLTHGRRLLDALGGLEAVHLVGGAVRDLALDRTPRELDLVAEHDGPGVARELARRLGGELRVHDTFGTATVTEPELLIDVATARAESYPAPGALPLVRGGSLEEDMARRDFTVNAIAVGVSPDVRGEVHAFPGAIEDLQAGRLRVLHDRSFIDDPTRLIRLARYGTRLNFVLHPRTEQLARAAFAANAPETAGVARMGRELWLLLGEPGAIAGLELLEELGSGGPFVVDRARLERVEELLPDDVSREHALLAALAVDVAEPDLASWLDAAHVVRAGIVLDAARDPAALAAAMRAATSASELAAAVRGRTPEAVAVAGAHGAQEQARRWLGDLRHVKLAIGGADLMAAGVPEGPEIGRRLSAALAKKLDGEARTREEELAAAMSSL